MSAESSASVEADSVKKEAHLGIKHLVFSGGGFKAYALFGVYATLDQMKLLDNLETLVGNSAGSAMAILIALKYTPDELYSFVTDFDYKKLKEWNFINITTQWGIETGTKLEQFMLKLIVNKLRTDGNSHPRNWDPTFMDLYQYNPVELTIVATKLNTHELMQYNYRNTPNESIAKSFRKSIALPGIIAPVFEFDASTNQRITYVDGAVIDNFPIQLCPDEPETVGVLLEECHHNFREIEHLEQYIVQLFNCRCSSVTHEKIKQIKKAYLNIFISKTLLFLIYNPSCKTHYQQNSFHK